MLLEVNCRLTGGVAILDLLGRVTSGVDADSLRNHMMEAFQHSSRFIVLNCERLSYADSSSLGEMVYAYSSIVQRGGMVKLLRPHQRMMHLLEITHLDNVFEVHDDERKAVASFNVAGVAKSHQTMNAFLKEG